MRVARGSASLLSSHGRGIGIQDALTQHKNSAPSFDAFELWCWRRLLRVHCTARTSNQSILKEIGPGISLEGMMLKLKLQYFGHLMPLLIATGEAIPLRGLEGVPGLPGAPQDEAGLMRKFER